MKAVLDFLLSCKRRDIIISFDGSTQHLKVKGNILALSYQDKEFLTQNKQEIISILNSALNKPGYTNIPALPPCSGYSLSSAQNRIWIQSQFENVGPVYNISAAYRFSGRLDVEVLRQALSYLIARHEILRTVFKSSESGEVKQLITPPELFPFYLIHHDFRTTPEAEKVIMEDVRNHNSAVFDLAKGPLLTAALYQVADENWVFTYTMHHIISDGWSLGILIRELMAYYNADIGGNSFELPSLRIQYKDFAAWQIGSLTAESTSADRMYWKEQFSGVLPVMNMPADRIRPVIKTYEGAAVPIVFSADLTRGLMGLLSQNGATLFMGLLALVNSLLYRYTGHQDIVVGSPIAGRENVELENQIGFYVNTLALRTRIREEEDFISLVANIKQVLLGAYAHQTYPFDALIADLDLRRDLSRHPLFDVSINLQQYGFDLPVEARLAEITVDKYEHLETSASKFDFSFNFIIQGDALAGNITYDTNIYNHERVERMVEHLQHLLIAILADPKKPVQRLHYLGALEKRNLLSGFNSSTVAYPAGKTVATLFEQQARKTPDNIAVLFEEEKLTYKELDTDSDAFAFYLAERYLIKAGDRIGILLDRSTEMIVAVMGILKSGCAYVPVDPKFPQERISFMLKDSDCKLLVDHEEFAKIKTLKTPDAGRKFEVVNVPDELAYIIYTSGSTGNPKGVMIKNEALVDYSYGIRNRTNVADCKTFGLVSTLSADLGNTVIFTSLLLGATLCIIDTLKADFKRDIDCLKIVPSHWKSLQQKDKWFIPSTCLIFGGEALTADTVQLIKTSGRTCEIYNHYGPTETTIGKLIDRVDVHNSAADITLGKPFCNSRIYVLDELNELTPIGVNGELCIAGVGLAKGYVNQAGLTAEKFISDPFVPGDRIYKTGDLVNWLPDGRIAFVGRKDNQVKIRGNRIELGEIEKVIRQHPDINSAVVTTESGTNGESELVGYIVSEQKFNSSMMRKYLLQWLPDYMIPLQFVQLDFLPLTLNGKIDKGLLPAIAEMPSGNDYVAPASDTEIAIVQIWEEVLGRQGIGIYDNFFDLGGHSLKAMRVASLIHRDFNVQLNLHTLFQNPTVANLSIEIEKILWCSEADSPMPDSERVTI